MKNMQNSDDRPMILIVDDTPTNIQVLAEALCSDYRVKVATSGKTALAMVNTPESRPDLILLDVMMPEMDGYEVCRRLKESQATQDIPIIFVTAKNDVTDEEYGLRLGAMDYIVKPFRLAIVKARVLNHINLKTKTDLLETLALVDGLTGIPNRRRFDEVLDNEWKRAQRDCSALAVIMADIDYFKAYNDTYGHGAGDQCLKAVAKALVSSLNRPSDMLARYGGEEFVAVMPDTEAEGAHTLAERLRANIAALALPHQSSNIENYITISVGYASLRPAQYQSPMELVGMADKMLYKAKELGRNRVCGALI